MILQFYLVRNFMNYFLIELMFKRQIMVILACSIACCLILDRLLSVFDRERDPLKEEELLKSNRLCLLSCHTVSNKFKLYLTFLKKTGYTFII